MKLDKSRIRTILPQSDPILLVDQAEILPGTSASSQVFVNPEWDIFCGHFPSVPVLPGIYITENMAQTADLLLLTIPGNEKKFPMFSAIRQMRFLRPVYPGDTLTCRAVLTCDAGKGMYDCEVISYCRGKKAALGILTLTLKTKAAVLPAAPK